MSWNPLSIIQSVTSAGEKVLDTFVENKNDRAKAKEQLNIGILGAVSKENQGQLEVNKVEAGHRSVFVAGWRPGLGWVCTASFAWAFVLRPMVESIMVGFGVDTDLLPEIEIDEIKEILKGMLGLGALRTYEKIKGVTK